MKVDRQVIIDLLPVYFSGEASIPTRTLVEEHFREDPELERIARNANRSVEGLKIEALSPDAEKEKEALKRTRSLVQARNIWMGFAVGYCLLPFAFIFSGNRITWMMLRDNPKGAIMFGVFGIICWTIFLIHNRMIKKAGI
jgi:predicted anti-sigma-YlaC factor YlaD